MRTNNVRGTARPGTARRGKAGHGTARPGKARRGRAGHGRAWRGVARRGVAAGGGSIPSPATNQGKALAGRGSAGQGEAGRGTARHGGARQGKAWEIMNCDRCVMDQDPRYEGSPWFHQLWCPNRPDGPIWDRWPTGRLYEEDDDH